jgi:hypothetical protein
MADISSLLSIVESRSLPIVYGTGRVTPIVAYKGVVSGPTDAGWRYEDGAWKSVAGRGANVLWAVCEAPIVEFTKAYRDGVALAPADFYRLNETWTTWQYQKVAVNDSALSTTFMPGLPTDLGNMTLKATAYFAVPFCFMNEDGSVPDVKFEVRGMCLTGANVNAHPADVVIDLLTNTRYGLGLPSSAIVTDVGPDGNAASSYRTYCTALGWGVSRVIEGGEDAADLLESLLFCTNAVLVQSEGKLKIVPRGDVAVTANGATYTPPATAAVLDADEILKDPGQDPITVERVGDDQVFNRWPVRIRNRAADYKESEYETPDASIPGLDRRASPVDGSWFTDAAQAARLSSLLAKRSIYSRNTYRFRVKGRWAALEVMDYVSISEPVTGVSNVLCRIESIRRLRDGSIEIAAREAPEGSATPVDYTPQTEDGYSHPMPGFPTVPRARELTVDMAATPPSDNLIPNPNSDAPAPPAGWVVGSLELAGLTNYPGAAYQGTWCRKVEALSTALATLTVSPRIAVAEGEGVYAEAMIAPEATATNNGTTLLCGRMVIAWLDSADAEFAWAYKDPTTSGSYGKVVLSATAPSGVTAMRMRFEVLGQAKLAYIDNMVLRKATGYGQQTFIKAYVSGPAAYASTFTVSFATAEPDANYTVLVSFAGYFGTPAPPAAAKELESVSRSTTGFTVTLKSADPNGVALSFSCLAIGLRKGG